MSDQFAFMLLRDARREARAAGVQVPAGLHAQRVVSAGNPWFEVRSRAGELVWSGSASDAWEARANAISELIAAATQASIANAESSETQARQDAGWLNSDSAQSMRDADQLSRTRACVTCEPIELVAGAAPETIAWRCARADAGFLTAPGAYCNCRTHQAFDWGD